MCLVCRLILLAATLTLVGCQTTNEASNKATDNNKAETKSDPEQHFITSECGKVAPGAVGLVGVPLGLGGWFLATGVAHLADHQACSSDKTKKPWADPDKTKPS